MSKPKIIGRTPEGAPIYLPVTKKGNITLRQAEAAVKAVKGKMAKP